MGLSVLHRLLEKSSIGWILGSRKNQGRVRRGISRFVRPDGLDIARIAHHGLCLSEGRHQWNHVYGGHADGEQLTVPSALS